MNAYQKLGAANFGLLALAFCASIYIMRGRHSRKKVIAVSTAVLILMLCLSLFTAFIYREYHR